jgi:hypothetical protein
LQQIDLATGLGAAAMLVLLIGALIVAAAADPPEPVAVGAVAPLDR